MTFKPIPAAERKIEGVPTAAHRRFVEADEKFEAAKHQRAGFQVLAKLPEHRRALVQYRDMVTHECQEFEKTVFISSQTNGYINEYYKGLRCSTAEKIYSELRLIFSEQKMLCPSDLKKEILHYRNDFIGRMAEMDKYMLNRLGDEIGIMEYGGVDEIRQSGLETIDRFATFLARLIQQTADLRKKIEPIETGLVLARTRVDEAWEERKCAHMACREPPELPSVK